MGAPPRLKIKDELHYRKGSTNEGRNCRHCENFTEDTLYDGSAGIGKYSMRWPERCKLIVAHFGAGCGIRYRVLSNMTCDAQKFNEADLSGKRYS